MLRDEILIGMRDLGMAQTHAQRADIAGCDLALRGPQHVALKRHHPLCELHALALHDRAIESAAQLALHAEAHGADLRLGRRTERVGGMQARRALAI